MRMGSVGNVYLYLVVKLKGRVVLYDKLVIYYGVLRLIVWFSSCFFRYVLEWIENVRLGIILYKKFCLSFFDNG